jgi:hypothetical protein
MISAEGRPQWWSMTITRAALRLIPAGGTRDRWQQELVTELYGLSRSEQARHTWGVVTRAPALRAAASAPDRTVLEAVMRRPLRCKVGWHRWTHRYTDEHLRYLECTRCRKQGDAYDYLPPMGWG